MAPMDYQEYYIGVIILLILAYAGYKVMVKNIEIKNLTSEINAKDNWNTSKINELESDLKEYARDLMNANQAIQSKNRLIKDLRNSLEVNDPIEIKPKRVYRRKKKQ